MLKFKKLCVTFLRDLRRQAQEIYLTSITQQTGIKTGRFRPTNSKFHSFIFAALLGLCTHGQVHAQVATTTQLSVSAATVSWPTPVTFTATIVAGGKPVTPGLVTFCQSAAAQCQGPAILGTAQLGPAGTAKLKLALGVGPHSVKAVFAGTKAAGVSTSPSVTVNVTGLFSTNAVLTATGTTGNYALSAAVSGAGSQSPTGQVTFTDGVNVALGSATLAAGAKSMSFNPSVLTGTGSIPIPLAVGDLNGDGLPDVAVANNSPNSSGMSTLTIFFSTGPGSYSPPVNIALTPDAMNPVGLVAGDFNNDGNLDLAVASAPNVIDILLGDGHGNFSAELEAQAPGMYPSALATGDFNNDGNLDLAITNQFASTVIILLGNGNGAFTAVSDTPPSTGATPDAIATGDFNRDGKQDLAIANHDSNTVTILLGNGDGTFTAAASPNTDVYPDAVAVGDFNRDGKLDLAVVNNFSQTVTVLLGDGSGAFAIPATGGYTAPATGKYPTAIAIGDLNGDGVQDLAIASSGASAVTVLFGKGDGTFTNVQTIAAGSALGQLAIADTNGDSRPDIVVTNSGVNTVTTLVNTFNASATATLSGVSVPGTGSQNIVAHYVGNAVYAGSDSAAVVLPGTPLPSTTTLNVKPSGTVAVGTTVQLTASIPSAFGGSLMPTGSVSFYNGSTAVAIEPVVNGVAVFNYTLTSPGTANLFARYSGDGSFMPSGSVTMQINVIAPVASTMMLSASSKLVTKGTVITLTAEVASGGKPVTQGLVTFCNSNYFPCEDGGVLGTAQLTSAGTASIKLALPVGTTPILALFGGTAQVLASKSNGQIVIVTGPLPTATVFSVTGTPGNYSFTGTVTASWPPPQGRVSFIDTSNSNLSIWYTSLPTSSPKLTQSSVTSVGTSPYSEAVGDFNGDGKPDVAVANYTANSMSVLLGNSNGTLTAVASPVSGTPNFNRPIAIVAGDFDGDGKLDLAVANATSNNVTVLLGNGNGTFAVKSVTTTGAGPSSIAVGDFNGDGKQDLAVANYSANTITLLLGNGDGTFLPEAEPPSVALPSAIVAADFNRDGKLDLAVVSTASNTATILLGTGDGTFTTASVSPNAGSIPTKIVAADFNADGIPDLAITDFGSQSVTILLGKGDGTFTPGASVPTGFHPTGITVGDFDGNQFTDLVVCDQGGAGLTLLIGLGNGSFAPRAIPLASGSIPAAVAVGDINADGGPDLAVTDVGSGVVRVLLNTAVSTVTLTGAAVPGAGTHQVEAVYAGSGTIYSPGTSNAIALSATPIPTTTVLTESPWIVPAGTTVTVTANVSPVSADNYTLSGTVSLYDGGTLVGTNTLSSGQATFKVGLAALGTHNLTAKYNASTTFAASSSSPLPVYVAPASTTTLSVSASSVTAGTPVTLTATVVSGGKPVTPGIVTFCNASSAACQNSAALGTANLTANGTASVKLTLGIGTQSIKAAFAGTVKDLSSTSGSQTITVKGLHATTTTLTDAVVSGKYTLTAVVKGSGVQAPTGNVSFSAANLTGRTALGTVALGSATAPTLSFTALVNSAALGTPLATAVGDFNRDGKPDLVVGDIGHNIWLGNGDGTFTQKSSTGTGATPVSIAVGDFNGDGIPDLASVDFTSSAVHVLLGKGDGTFTLKSSPATGSAPIAVAVGDFNADGKLDLAVANDVGGTVSVLLGNGDGTFAPQTVLTLGGTLRGIAVGDFNQDGKADLAVASLGTVAIVLLGNGDGTFQQLPFVTVGRNPERIVIADFNADGKPDLATANTGDGTLSIALGKGDGSFSAASTISLGTGVTPQWLSIADFNQDGKADLVVTVSNKPEALILLGNGNGTFGLQATPSSTGNPPQFLAVGDFNGDGEPDLAFTVYQTPHASAVLNTLSISATATLSGVTLSGTTNQSVQASYAGSTVDAPSTSIAISLPPM